MTFEDTTNKAIRNELRSKAFQFKINEPGDLLTTNLFNLIMEVIMGNIGLKMEERIFSNKH